MLLMFFDKPRTADDRIWKILRQNFVFFSIHRQYSVLWVIFRVILHILDFFSRLFHFFYFVCVVYHNSDFLHSYLTSVLLELFPGEVKEG